MKALQKASAAGQRIYQITPETMGLLGNINHDPGTMAEIQAALNTGKTVITHTDSVSVPGWTGAGYVILDAETNVGAWKISGGSNGAFLGVISDIVQILAVLALIVLTGVLVPLLFILSLAIIAALLTSSIFLESSIIIVGLVLNLIELLNTFESTAFAIALVAIFAFVDIVVAVLLAVTGIGLLLIAAVELLLFQLENFVVDWAQETLLCRPQ